ncbi:MAG: DUF2214 domain-containing protein [Candidatus Obscuribacterales bacterium]|nr:DUF2214 domain-containing protein [Steroidobacteraceae bacterium]
MVDWRGLLAWIEASALGNAVRDSGVWTYGVINLFHILGVATLFGSVLVLDLRLLGWRRSIALSNIASATVPLAVIGFCVAVISGVCLLTTNATEYASNPFLLIKFAAIALALVNVIVLSYSPAWKSRSSRQPSSGERTQLATLGGISLLCWLTAISAGRMIGYW